ncbi:hypothetical protein Rs2_19063 [Raphanus sativus]|nr:hypothetical protein Rs2_19063 [Raphanus sativus]
MFLALEDEKFQITHRMEKDEEDLVVFAAAPAHAPYHEASKSGGSFFFIDIFNSTNVLCRRNDSSSCNAFSTLPYIEVVYGAPAASAALAYSTFDSSAFGEYMGTKESCFLTSRARSLVRCSVLQKARRGCCFQERGHRAILFKLILAANYLNIKNLFDLTCQTVADMIKGEEIRTGPSTSITTLHLRRKRRCVGRTNRLLNDV